MALAHAGRNLGSIANLESWGRSVVEMASAEARLSGTDVVESLSIYPFVEMDTFRAHLGPLSRSSWHLFHVLVDKTYHGRALAKEFFDWIGGRCAASVRSIFVRRRYILPKVGGGASTSYIVAVWYASGIHVAIALLVAPQNSRQRSCCTAGNGNANLSHFDDREHDDVCVSLAVDRRRAEEDPDLDDPYPQCVEKSQNFRAGRAARESPQRPRLPASVWAGLQLVLTQQIYYEDLGKGVCACRNPTRKNGLELDFCNSDVIIRRRITRENTQPPFVSPTDEACRTLCSDAADCMAYQESSMFVQQSWYHTRADAARIGEGSYCVLWLWHRVPIGVFGLVDIGKSNFSDRQKEGLLEWQDVPCLRKRKVVQLTAHEFKPFELDSKKFAIMPRERDLNGGNGLDRFCTCRATTPTGKDDTEDKETVCRVADEKENMSQEAAESLCLERNRRAALLGGSTNEKDRESADRGCAGFMSFTPLFSDHHPKAKHVLFFSGYQNVTGIAATKEEYEQKGGTKTGPASFSPCRCKGTACGLSVLLVLTKESKLIRILEVRLLPLG
eukprot:g2869.t1